MWNRLIGKTEDTPPYKVSRRKAEDSSTRERSGSTVSASSSKARGETGDDRAKHGRPRMQRRQEFSPSRDGGKTNDLGSRSRHRKHRERDKGEERGKLDMIEGSAGGRSRDPRSADVRADRSGDQAGDISRHRSYSFNAQTQFPAQHDSPLPGLRSPQPPAKFSSHVSDQFPGQDPAQYAAPFRPPSASAPPSGYGEAASYYGDQGQSVLSQPGVRPDKPTNIVGSQPHLTSPSLVSNPPQETGDGQVTEPLPSGNTAQTPNRPPRPGVPSVLQSSTQSNTPGKTSNSSPLSPAAGPSHAAIASGNNTYQLDPYSVGTGSTGKPNRLDTYSSVPSTSSPSRPSKQSSDSALTLLAAGAAGLAVGDFAAHHGANQHTASPAPDTNNHHDNQGDAPPHTQEVMAMQGQRPHRRALRTFIDWWSDYEDVRKMEEYTEYIGVCRGCFDPRTSVSDAPRKHLRRRRSSDSLESGRRRVGTGRRYDYRVDKERRYSSSDTDGRRKRNKNHRTSTGFAGYGLAKIGQALWDQDYQFQETNAVRSSSQFKGKTGSPAQVVLPARSHSKDTKITGVTSDGRPYRKTLHDGVHVKASNSGRRLGRSASRSRSRPSSKATEEVSVARLAARHGSHSPSRSTGRRTMGSSWRSRDASPVLGNNNGMFAGWFRSSTGKSPSTSSRRKKRFFYFGNSSSSSSDALAYGSGIELRQERNSRKAKTSSDDDVKAAILGLGAAAAALSVSGSRNRKHGQRAADLFAVKEPQSRRESRRSRKKEQVSSSDDNEEDWESASDNDDSSNVDSELAYGEFDYKGNGLARKSTESLLSGSSGTSKWEWRWGSKKKRKKASAPDLRTPMVGSFAPDAADDSGETPGTAPATRHGNTTSDTNLPILQHVDPMPISGIYNGDYNRRTVNRSSPASSDLPPRPAPLPLQQPQPIAPISTTIYTTQPKSHAAYVAPTGPPVFARAPPPLDAAARPGQTAYAPSAGLSQFPPRQSEEVDHRTLRAGIAPRRGYSSPAISTITKDVATADIGTGLPGGVLFSPVAHSELVSPGVRFDLTKDQAAKESRERELYRAGTENANEKRDEVEDTERQNRERRERRRVERRERDRGGGEEASDRHAPAPTQEAEQQSEREKQRERQQQHRPQLNPYLLDDSEMAAQAGDYTSAEPSQSGQPSETQRPPDGDHDHGVYAAREYRKGKENNAKIAEIERMNKSEIVEDLRSSYNEASPSMAAFFAPSELSSDEKQEQSYLKRPNADYDLQPYAGPEMMKYAGQHSYSGETRPGTSSNDPTPSAVPYLTVQGPTPPPDLTRAPKAVRSQSSSPLKRSAEVPLPDPKRPERKQSVASDGGHSRMPDVEFTQSTLSDAEPDGSRGTNEVAVQKPDTQFDPSSDVIVESAHMPGGFEDDVEKVLREPDDDVPSEPQQHGFYQSPYYETVTDLGSGLDVSGTEPPTRPPIELLQAETDGPTSSMEKERSAQDHEFQPKLSNKERRKRDKAAKRQTTDEGLGEEPSLFNVAKSQDGQTTQADTARALEPPMSIKAQKQRDKTSKQKASRKDQAIIPGHNSSFSEITTDDTAGSAPSAVSERAVPFDEDVKSQLPKDSAGSLFTEDKGLRIAVPGDFASAELGPKEDADDSEPSGRRTENVPMKTSNDSEELWEARQLKKKSKRRSARYSSPFPGSPLKSEVSYDDYTDPRLGQIDQQSGSLSDNRTSDNVGDKNDGQSQGGPSQQPRHRSPSDASNELSSSPSHYAVERRDTSFPSPHEGVNKDRLHLSQKGRKPCGNDPDSNTTINTDESGDDATDRKNTHSFLGEGAEEDFPPLPECIPSTPNQQPAKTGPKTEVIPISLPMHPGFRPVEALLGAHVTVGLGASPGPNGPSAGSHIEDAGVCKQTPLPAGSSILLQEAAGPANLPPLPASRPSSPTDAERTVHTRMTVDVESMDALPALPPTRATSPISVGRAEDLPPLPATRPSSPLDIGSAFDLPSLPASRSSSPIAVGVAVNLPSLPATRTSTPVAVGGAVDLPSLPATRPSSPIEVGRSVDLPPLPATRPSSPIEVGQSTDLPSVPVTGPSFPIDVGWAVDLPPLPASRPLSPIEVDRAIDLPFLPATRPSSTIDVGWAVNLPPLLATRPPSPIEVDRAMNFPTLPATRPTSPIEVGSAIDLPLLPATSPSSPIEADQAIDAPALPATPPSSGIRVGITADWSLLQSSQASPLTDIERVAGPLSLVSDKLDSSSFHPPLVPFSQFYANAEPFVPALRLRVAKSESIGNFSATPSPSFTNPEDAATDTLHPSSSTVHPDCDSYFSSRPSNAADVETEHGQPSPSAQWFAHNVKSIPLHEPGSPYTFEEVAHTIPAKERSPTSTPPLRSRGVSTTAIPLRFRVPASPGAVRDQTTSSPLAGQPTSPPSLPRTRHSRPSSTEFKSNEFRPLYLLERNRKTPEVEEMLPPLPSSRTTSRSSSVQASDDEYQSALESPDPGTARDEDEWVVSGDEADFLDSQQPTPKASTLPEECLPVVPDYLPLDHVDELLADIPPRPRIERPAIAERFYTASDLAPSNQPPTRPDGAKDSPQQPANHANSIPASQPLQNAVSSILHKAIGTVLLGSAAVETAKDVISSGNHQSSTAVSSAKTGDTGKSEGDDTGHIREDLAKTESVAAHRETSAAKALTGNDSDRVDFHCDEFRDRPAEEVDRQIQDAQKGVESWFSPLIPFGSGKGKKTKKGKVTALDLSSLSDSIPETKDAVDSTFEDGGKRASVFSVAPVAQFPGMVAEIPYIFTQLRPVKSVDHRDTQNGPVSQRPAIQSVAIAEESLGSAMISESSSTEIGSSITETNEERPLSRKSGKQSTGRKGKKGRANASSSGASKEPMQQSTDAREDRKAIETGPPEQMQLEFLGAAASVSNHKAPETSRGRLASLAYSVDAQEHKGDPVINKQKSKGKNDKKQKNKFSMFEPEHETKKPDLSFPSTVIPWTQQRDIGSVLPHDEVKSEACEPHEVVREHTSSGLGQNVLPHSQGFGETKPFLPVNNISDKGKSPNELYRETGEREQGSFKQQLSVIPTSQFFTDTMPYVMNSGMLAYDPSPMQAERNLTDATPDVALHSVSHWDYGGSDAAAHDLKINDNVLASVSPQNLSMAHKAAVSEPAQTEHKALEPHAHLLLRNEKAGERTETRLKDILAPLSEAIINVFRSTDSMAQPVGGQSTANGNEVEVSVPPRSPGPDEPIGKAAETAIFLKGDHIDASERLVKNMGDGSVADKVAAADFRSANNEAADNVGTNELSAQRTEFSSSPVAAPASTEIELAMVKKVKLQNKKEQTVDIGPEQEPEITTRETEAAQDVAQERNEHFEESNLGTSTEALIEQSLATRNGKSVKPKKKDKSRRNQGGDSFTEATPPSRKVEAVLNSRTFRGESGTPAREKKGRKGVRALTEDWAHSESITPVTADVQEEAFDEIAKDVPLPSDEESLPDSVGNAAQERSERVAKPRVVNENDEASQLGIPSSSTLSSADNERLMESQGSSQQDGDGSFGYFLGNDAVEPESIPLPSGNDDGLLDANGEQDEDESLSSFSRSHVVKPELIPLPCGKENELTDANGLYPEMIPLPEAGPRGADSLRDDELLDAIGAYPEMIPLPEARPDEVDNLRNDELTDANGRNPEMIPLSEAEPEEDGNLRAVPARSRPSRSDTATRYSSYRQTSAPLASDTNVDAAAMTTEHYTAPYGNGQGLLSEVDDGDLAEQDQSTVAEQEGELVTWPLSKGSRKSKRQNVNLVDSTPEPSRYATPVEQIEDAIGQHAESGAPAEKNPTLPTFSMNASLNSNSEVDTAHAFVPQDVSKFANVEKANKDKKAPRLPDNVALVSIEPFEEASTASAMLRANTHSPIDDWAISSSRKKTQKAKKGMSFPESSAQALDTVAIKQDEIVSHISITPSEQLEPFKALEPSRHEQYVQSMEPPKDTAKRSAESARSMYDHSLENQLTAEEWAISSKKKSKKDKKGSKAKQTMPWDDDAPNTGSTTGVATYNNNLEDSAAPEDLDGRGLVTRLEVLPNALPETLAQEPLIDEAAPLPATGQKKGKKAKKGKQRLMLNNQPERTVPPSPTAVTESTFEERTGYLQNALPEGLTHPEDIRPVVLGDIDQPAVVIANDDTKQEGSSEQQVEHFAAVAGDLIEDDPKTFWESSSKKKGGKSNKPKLHAAAGPAVPPPESEQSRIQRLGPGPESEAVNAADSQPEDAAVPESEAISRAASFSRPLPDRKGSTLMEDTKDSIDPLSPLVQPADIPLPPKEYDTLELDASSDKGVEGDAPLSINSQEAVIQPADIPLPAEDDMLELHDSGNKPVKGDAPSSLNSQEAIIQPADILLPMEEDDTLELDDSSDKPLKNAMTSSIDNQEAYIQPAHIPLPAEDDTIELAESNDKLVNGDAPLSINSHGTIIKPAEIPLPAEVDTLDDKDSSDKPIKHGQSSSINSQRGTIAELDATPGGKQKTTSPPSAQKSPKPAILSHCCDTVAIPISDKHTMSPDGEVAYDVGEPTHYVSTEDGDIEKDSSNRSEEASGIRNSAKDDINTSAYTSEPALAEVKDDDEFGFSIAEAIGLPTAAAEIATSARHILDLDNATEETKVKNHMGNGATKRETNEIVRTREDVVDAVESGDNKAADRQAVSLTRPVEDNDYPSTTKPGIELRPQDKLKRSKKDKRKEKKAKPAVFTSPDEQRSPQEDEALEASRDHRETIAQEGIVSRGPENWSSAAKRSRKDKKKPTKSGLPYLEPEHDEAPTVSPLDIAAAASPAESNVTIKGPVQAGHTDSNGTSGETFGNMSLHYSSHNVGADSPIQSNAALDYAKGKNLDATKLPGLGERQEQSSVEGPIDNGKLDPAPGTEFESLAVDFNFAATLAAGLAGSGFDPNIVLYDAKFHHRASPVSSALDLSDDEYVTVNRAPRRRRSDKERPISSTGSQHELVPQTDLSREKIENTEPLANDEDFVATLAAGLHETGFDPDIVLEDPTFRERECPTVAPDPNSEFLASFARPRRSKSQGSHGSDADVGRNLVYMDDPILGLQGYQERDMIEVPKSSPKERATALHEERYINKEPETHTKEAFVDKAEFSPLISQMKIEKGKMVSTLAGDYFEGVESIKPIVRPESVQAREIALPLTPAEEAKTLTEGVAFETKEKSETESGTQPSAMETFQDGPAANATSGLETDETRDPLVQVVDNAYHLNKALVNGPRENSERDDQLKGPEGKVQMPATSAREFLGERSVEPDGTEGVSAADESTMDRQTLESPKDLVTSEVLSNVAQQPHVLAEAVISAAQSLPTKIANIFPSLQRAKRRAPSFISKEEAPTSTRLPINQEEEWKQALQFVQKEEKGGVQQPLRTRPKELPEERSAIRSASGLLPKATAVKSFAAAGAAIQVASALTSTESKSKKSKQQRKKNEDRKGPDWAGQGAADNESDDEAQGPPTTTEPSPSDNKILAAHEYNGEKTREMKVEPDLNLPEDRDSAIRVSDSSFLEQEEVLRAVLRDSGYDDPSVSSPLCEPQEGQARTQADEDYAGMTETSNSSADPLRISVEFDPKYEISISRQRPRPQLATDIGDYHQPIYEQWRAHVSTSAVEEGADLPQPPLTPARSVEDLGAPSPVESTTKDRISYLFQSSPSSRKVPDSSAYGLYGTNIGGEAVTRLPAQSDDYFSHAAGLSGASPSDPKSIHPARGYNSSGLQDHQIGQHYRPEQPSHAQTQLHSPNLPAESIVEHSSLESQTKRSRSIREVTSPEPVDRGLKAARRILSSDQSFRNRIESGVAASPLSRRHGSEERILVATVDPNTVVLSPHAREAHLGSGIDSRVGLDTPTLRRSDQRSVSSHSVRSTGSISHYSVGEHFRPLSGHSNRSGTPPLRRVSRHVSGDLRASSRLQEPRAADSAGPGLDLRTATTANRRTSQGKGHAEDMVNSYEGRAGVQDGPLSPTRDRPPSRDMRQSMQTVELQSRLDQLTAENCLLQDAKAQAERNASEANYQCEVDAQALAEAGRIVEARDRELCVKGEQLAGMEESFKALQQELARLKEINDGLTTANKHLSANTDERYATLQRESAAAHQKWQQSTKDLQALEAQYGQLVTGMEDIVRHEIANALEDKNSELQRIRRELEVTREDIRALQQQILASKAKDDYLVARDEDYFDSACQQLCQHVQQWVLRFSKLSDHRMCRLTSELKDDKIEAKLEDAILDGSDVDTYLADRIQRRDVFMSVVMKMIWEYIFTRYLFGMDRDQRHKLKMLEKTLSEVGPARAVAHWRATTLTLLSRRPQFLTQRAQDTEAVAQEIYTTLSTLLPPPPALSGQIMDSLRNLLKLAVTLSIEMRTQRAEYIMLPPLQPEYDPNTGMLTRKVFFNASLMNERSGDPSVTTNEDLERRGAVLRLVLFPLVVKKGDDLGEGDEEIVVAPAQVLIARPTKDRKVVRVMSGALEIERPRSFGTEMSGLESGMI